MCQWLSKHFIFFNSFNPETKSFMDEHTKVDSSSRDQLVKAILWNNLMSSYSELIFEEKYMWSTI